jgi:D-beta-D-heptose 7-phosphate kinase/D-beta-D-heptose 1-phosphate adenosyltransferase
MIIPQQKQFTILLIGDYCTDIYQYGTVDRISPEAPVPVFKFNYEEQRPGMAGNVYQNLIALGCDVQFLHGNTSIKTRLIDSRSKQHIVRIDNDVVSMPLELETDVPPVYDAIVISDYNKGTVSYELIEKLKHQGIPVFIDTKKTDLARLEGCYVKINSLEYSLAKTFPTELIVTTGKDGAMYKGQSYPTPVVSITDTCGAGDTFLAALVYQQLSTSNIHQAIEFANVASSITVQHSGVYAPTLKEINENITNRT